MCSNINITNKQTEKLKQTNKSKKTQLLKTEMWGKLMPLSI